VPEPLFDTANLQRWLARTRTGEQAAADELLRAAWDRLERLARAMLGRFPAVHRWAETGDVLQSALVRLVRALEKVEPTSTREFFGLAAEQMRRELLDLARSYRGACGLGANHASVAHRPGEDSSAVPWDPAAPASGHEELERWAAFHEAVERLPAAEREVVALVFYHGWTQTQIAELFGMDERTIRRWWRSACGQLHEALGGKLPEGTG
jgi:RNA polymerase sigma-70 factor (ECF subfamily)